MGPSLPVRYAAVRLLRMKRLLDPGGQQTCQVTAVAAAVAGETRCVRTSTPWRPRKLRLLVEATRSPAWARSPLMPTHMEQPLSRHSKPASMKIRSSPSASAWRFTRKEPGEMMRLLHLHLRPLATAAAARRSLDSAVGARADENLVHRYVLDGLPRFQPDIVERVADFLGLFCRLGRSWVGYGSGYAGSHVRDWCPRSAWVPAGAVEPHFNVERCAPRRWAGPAMRPALCPNPRHLAARSGGL